MARGWGSACGELWFRADRVSVWGHEKVPEVGGGEGCTKGESTYCHWTAHLQMVKTVHLCYVYFTII